MISVLKKINKLFIFLYLYFYYTFVSNSFAKIIKLNIKQNYLFFFPQNKINYNQLTSLEIFYSKYITKFLKYSFGFNLLLKSDSFLFTKNFDLTFVPYIYFENNNNYYRFIVSSRLKTANEGANTIYSISKSLSLNIKKTRTLINLGDRKDNIVYLNKTKENKYISFQQYLSKIFSQKINLSYSENYENGNLTSKNIYGTYLASKNFNFLKTKNNFSYILKAFKNKNYKYHCNIITIENIQNPYTEISYTKIFDGILNTYEEIPSNEKILIKFLENSTFNKIRIYTNLDPKNWDKILSINVYLSETSPPIYLKLFNYYQEKNYWVYEYTLNSPLTTDNFYIEFISTSLQEISINEIEIINENIGVTNLIYNDHNIILKTNLKLKRGNLAHSLNLRYIKQEFNSQVQKEIKYVSENIYGNFGKNTILSFNLGYSLAESLTLYNQKKLYLDLIAQQNLKLKKQKIFFSLSQKFEFFNKEKENERYLFSISKKSKNFKTKLGINFDKNYLNDTLAEETTNLNLENSIYLSNNLYLDTKLSRKYTNNIFLNTTNTYTDLNLNLNYKLYSVLFFSLNYQYNFNNKYQFYQTILGYKPTNKINLSFLLSKEIFSFYLSWHPYISPYINLRGSLKYINFLNENSNKVNCNIILNYKKSKGNIIKFGGGYSYVFSSPETYHIISFFLALNY